jgi:hypothetical protein
MALTVASALVGATTHRGEFTHRVLLSPFYTPTGAVTTIPSSSTTLPLEAGFRGVENFCAVAPLHGMIHYDGTSGGLSGVLMVSVSGLPPNDKVFVNWSNDHIRVPVIASFETDSEGAAAQSSVVVGRLGEVRGVEVLLSAERVPNPILGHLEPC